jgi:hypothetical protein
MRKLILRALTAALLTVAPAAAQAETIHAESQAPGEITVKWGPTSYGDVVWGSYPEGDLGTQFEPEGVYETRIEHLTPGKYYPVSWVWGYPQQTVETSVTTLNEISPLPNGPATPSHQPPSATAVPQPPSITAVHQSHSIWREGSALAHASAKKTLPVGTTFSFSLNESATVTFEFSQSASGRKVREKCLAQTRKNKKDQSCTRTVLAGTLAFAAHSGENKVHFEGPISKHKKLKPGSYTLLVTAAASGNPSAPRTLHFTIVSI